MTKIAVVKQGVYAPDQSVIFWEPLVGQGMVAQERDVFEDFNAPVPQTTEEAVETKSLHEFNDLTQVCSISFVGNLLVYCPAEKDDTKGPSPIKKWLNDNDEYWANLADHQRSAMFEGTFSRCVDWNRYEREYKLDWKPSVAQDKKIYIEDLKASVVTLSPAAKRLREQMEQLLSDTEARAQLRGTLGRSIAMAFGVPTPYFQHGNYVYHSWYGSFGMPCHPSRLSGLDEFYSGMTADRAEDLEISLETK